MQLIQIFESKFTLRQFFHASIPYFQNTLLWVSALKMSDALCLVFSLPQCSHSLLLSLTLPVYSHSHLALCIMLVVMMRSKEIKTSELVLMLIVSLILSTIIRNQADVQLGKLEIDMREAIIVSCSNISLCSVSPIGYRPGYGPPLGAPPFVSSKPGWHQADFSHRFPHLARNVL